MARKYSLPGFDINTASTTILSLNASTTSRPMIYDLLVGSNATPADNAGVYALRRFSVSNGTGTALTPVALDFLNPASVHGGSRAHTTEPSYTANSDVLYWGQNQRATFRWVAAPGGELVSAAAANAGIGLICDGISGSAVTMTAVIHYEE